MISTPQMNHVSLSLVQYTALTWSSHSSLSPLFSCFDLSTSSPSSPPPPPPSLFQNQSLICFSSQDFALLFATIKTYDPHSWKGKNVCCHYLAGKMISESLNSLAVVKKAAGACRPTLTSRLTCR